MSRRSERMAQEAAAESNAAAASEAGRVLQAQRQPSERSELPTESSEPANSETESGFRPPLRNEPRREAMEEIRRSRDEMAGRVEPAPKQELPSLEPVPTLEAALVTPPAEVPAIPDPAVPAAVPTPEPIKTVRVKVDGEEFDAPQADVEEAGGIKPYQILRAADNRLRKANESVAETRRMQDAFLQAMQAQQPKAPAPLPMDQFIASKLDAIRYGTPEEGAAALMEIQQRSNPAVDQNALTTQTMIQINYQGAVKRFGAEFADVTANPLLMRLTQSLAQERLQQIPHAQLGQVDFDDFYRRIGNEVRSVARPNQAALAPAAPTAGPTSPVSSDKEARKSSIVNLPTAASRAELPKDEKPETREESINRMRKARGLPTG